MKILIRVGIVAFASFCLMLRAQAGEAGLAGTVTNSSGQPIQGAEIRIQGSDANKIGKIHTKANGRYNYPELEAGTYRVSLLVDGATKADIVNVRTKAGETQTLNFEILKGSRATPFAPGKHYVWVPQQTGSHLGTWAEVEGDGKGMPVGMSERLNNEGNNLVRQLQLKGADVGNIH
jgi:VCBS repeat-containing protein